MQIPFFKSPKVAIWCLIIGLVILLILNLTNRESHGDQAPTKDDAAEVNRPSQPVDDGPRPVGDMHLQDYGSDELTLLDDIERMARVTDGFFSIVKNFDTRHYATNRQLTEALLGKNPYLHQHISSSVPALDREKGELVDRYGTPLIFHIHAQASLEIRSAGPDKIGYTEDDILRLADGEIITGELATIPSSFPPQRNNPRNRR